MLNHTLSQNIYIFYMSKILLVIVLVTLSANAVRPPAPICRTSPLPSIIPVSIGETVRLDLQMLFDGYNLVFQAPLKDHIEITPKYTVNHSQFEKSMNFTSAKIKQHNRFLGLATHDHFTQLAIGINHPESGVVIEKTLTIEDQPQLHCYDVDEVIDWGSSKTFAIIDCGVYRMGQLHRNQFLFVDLTSYKLVLGSRTSDVYVRYNHLKMRKIQMMTDPFTRVEYLLRFYYVDGVDTEHSDQTYVEIFMMSNQSVMEIQILDVIDHTLLGLPSLAIYDYQIHFNYIYLLVRDSGLYQIQFTPTQRLVRTGFLPIKMNVNRFRVQQNGFNDDLHLIFSNDNTVYQFQWDVLSEPVLVTKYTLMPGSVVQEILMDENFVIVQAWEMFNDQLQRRNWVFTRRTLSYTNAFGSFKQPPYGPCIILYQPFERIIHIIYEYRSVNIRLNLPYLWVKPLSSQKAGDKQQYLVKAISSTGQSGQSIECRQTLNFIYIQNTDTTIFKTGLQGRNQTYVDAPDDAEFNLQYEFFGRNISYNVSYKIENDTNSTVGPEYYVQKRVKAQLNFPPEIQQSKIVYFEMFLQNTREEVEDRNQVFGIVQVQQTPQSHPIYYINCFVQIDAQFQNPILRCKVLTKTFLSMGKIKTMSQMFSPYERIAAIVYESKNTTVYLYEFYPGGFRLFGYKQFNSVYENKLSGAQITAKRQLLATFQFGKRIQVYNIDQLRLDYTQPSKPISIIDTRMMEFFRVNYWAPVSIKISIYHDEVAFVKTKTGVMAININEFGFPQLLFQIKTTTSLYDFEVNRDTLVIITQKQMQMHRLTRPLRRSQQPFLLQKYSSDFNLNEYDEINSDGLFYLVEKQDNMLLVVHPNMPSTSVIYTQFFIGNIKMIDAVRLHDKQVVFIFNGSQMLAYMFAENPKLRVRWAPNQANFTLNVSAYNEKSTSEPYSTSFQIIQSTEAYINMTNKFNATAVRKLGHVETTKNAKKIDINITLNDSDWFTGNVMHYFLKCKDCNKNVSDDQFNIVLQNHLKELNTQIVVGQPVYDMHSTFTGIFGQMFNAMFKTYSHNDSVQYILPLPTTSRGQVCSKMAVHNTQDYVLSFCQLGGMTHMYITTLNTVKPFTMGPFPTEAQAINHVEVVGNIVMIVDNDDDPFNRAGGVYLYYLNLAAKKQEDVFSMLDYLDYADLQIQGFRGTPFIASADILKPMFNRDEYVVFITEARTGNIFAFLFEVSANKQQAIYLQRRMFELNKLIPESAKHPTPLRIININIIDYTVKVQTRMQTEFVLLLTVKNWHHIQIMLLVDQQYDLLAFQLVRLYERVSYPWELSNFIRLRKGSLNASYFAVSYRDFSRGAQVLVVYELPYFRIDLPNGQKYHQQLYAGIPLTRVLAAYRIADTGQICFAFNTRDEHRLLFNDINTNHLSELQLNKQLKLVIKNADPSVVQAQNITIIAENHYTNLKFNFPDDDDDNKTKVEIIWIIVLVIGFIVVIGLIFAWSRQNRSSPRDSTAIKESLLTVQPQFKNNYINRSSADPESVRGTVDYSAPTPVPPSNGRKLQKLEEEGSDDHDPMDQTIQNKNKNESQQNLEKA